MTPKLTTADNRIDFAAVRAAMIKKVADNPLLVAGDVYDDVLRQALSEQMTREWDAWFWRQQEEKQQRIEAEAKRLASECGYDLDRIQFQRDRWFFGSSTARVWQLPIWERALELAQQRESQALQAAE